MRNPDLTYEELIGFLSDEDNSASYFIFFIEDAEVPMIGYLMNVAICETHILCVSGYEENDRSGTTCLKEQIENMVDQEITRFRFITNPLDAQW